MKKQKLSQEQIILGLLELGPVGFFTALKGAGSIRLSARIYDLRQKGANIVTEWKMQKGKRVASYRLIHKHGSGAKA